MKALSHGRRTNFSLWSNTLGEFDVADKIFMRRAKSAPLGYCSRTLMLVTYILSRGAK
jgi:hypothetical protein